MIQLQPKFNKQGNNLAIKDDIKVIKDEISTEEQFLESFIKSERFFKKNKKLFIGFGIVCLIAVTGYYISSFMEQNRIKTANEAYSKLLIDKNDKEAMETLKQKSPSMYALFKFKEFSEANNTNAIKSLTEGQIDPILKQIFLASIGESISDIGANYDTLLRGFKYLTQDKINEANAEFAKIPLDSPLSNLAKNLQHYQGYKK